MAVSTSALGTYLIASFLSQAEPLELPINDYFCMIEAIHYEANGEGSVGKQAVANVIMNRVERFRNQNTVCEVVHADNQFTYEKGIEIDLSKKPDLNSFKETIQIAYDAVQGNLEDVTDGSDHYLNPTKLDILPSWVNPENVTVEIGEHKFLRLVSDNGRWI